MSINMRIGITTPIQIKRYGSHHGFELKLVSVFVSLLSPSKKRRSKDYSKVTQHPNHIHMVHSG